jgi:hypothetical protein
MTFEIEFLLTWSLMSSVFVKQDWNERFIIHSILSSPHLLLTTSIITFSHLLLSFHFKFTSRVSLWFNDTISFWISPFDKTTIAFHLIDQLRFFSCWSPSLLYLLMILSSQLFCFPSTNNNYDAGRRSLGDIYWGYQRSLGTWFLSPLGFPEAMIRFISPHFWSDVSSSRSMSILQSYITRHSITISLNQRKMDWVLYVICVSLNISFHKRLFICVSPLIFDGELSVRRNWIRDKAVQVKNAITNQL